MTPEQFVYWLQGFYELALIGDYALTKRETIIRDHLQKVFCKMTPNRGVATFSDSTGGPSLTGGWDVPKDGTNGGIGQY